MFDFDAMATFVAVVRGGNFTAAATALHLPRSTVSQRVSRLEAMLGVRLLERTTRAVRPTSAGSAYYERCARLLADLEEANAAVTDAATTPRGTLRVAAPLLFGQVFLAGIASSFVRMYSDVSIEIVASDRRVNLIEEGFDVAVVVATREDDSDFITRKLGGGELWCCAAPDYLAAHGRPRSPEDLQRHACIVHGDARAVTWTFERGGDVRRIPIRGKLSLSSLAMLHEAARRGGGIASVPRFVCAEDIREGRLARVLPEWSLGRVDLRIVYPSRRHLSPRVRLFVDAVLAEVKMRTALR